MSPRENTLGKMKYQRQIPSGFQAGREGEEVCGRTAGLSLPLLSVRSEGER